MEPMLRKSLVAAQMPFEEGQAVIYMGKPAVYVRRAAQARHVIRVLGQQRSKTVMESSLRSVNHSDRHLVRAVACT